MPASSFIPAVPLRRPAQRRLTTLALLGVIITTTSLAAPAQAEPLFEKQDIWTGGVGGYDIYRIPGLVVTAKGTVLAYCEARKGSRSDWGTIDIQLRRSIDGGRTFSAPQIIAAVDGPKQKNPVALAQNLAQPNEVTYNNPVAFAQRNGTVTILFCLEYMRCFVIRSADDGLTWTKPEEITAAFEPFRKQYDWKVLATGPAHGIELRTGRLVVPVWLSLGTGGHAHRPSVTATIYSDDQGRTWHAGDIAVPNTEKFALPNETVVVELADGRVMLNVRSEAKANRRIVVTSPDGATGWSAPKFDSALLEPICMASILRVSSPTVADRGRILFANPHNLDRADGKLIDGKSRDRKNIALKLSYDEGKSWPVDKVLDAGFSAYSDLAILPDGTMLCLYESGGTKPADPKKPKPYAALTLVRFNLEWLTDGKDHGPKYEAAK
jgi:sialidase-1